MVQPGVYGNKTLNANWFEDRFQPIELLSATGDFERRRPRAVESDLAKVGVRYDVLSRIARMPTRLSYALPDDGFRESATVHQVDFVEHAMQTEQARAPPMISEANAPVCAPELRPLPGKTIGFGSSLPRHLPGHEARFWNTTLGDFFGKGSRKKVARADPSQLGVTGIRTEDVERRNQGVQCGVLCGENLTVSKDAAKDTRTQRTWLSGGDPALKNLDGGFKGILPRTDNETSLPLGAGAMSKIRADLAARRGRLTRIYTNITKSAGSMGGISLFQDD